MYSCFFITDYSHIQYTVFLLNMVMHHMIHASTRQNSDGNAVSLSSFGE